MRRSIWCVLIVLSLAICYSHSSYGDGKVIPPRQYEGSLEELAQEAMILFNGSDESNDATEDLILKILVQGDAREFAWVIPFPNEPKIAKEDPKLFKELFDYVQRQQAPRQKKSGYKSDKKADSENSVELLSRQVVGQYDIAVVRENEQGGLNPWLEREGFQTLENADDVLEFYRSKKYVYACIKVASEVLATQESIESHPLRFTFKTGGRDGIFFPMKMTGLQEKPFDVNLYVFYRAWLNDKLSRFGYRHRGFELHYRDWDSRDCEPDAGKCYSLPEEDPFLKSAAHRIPTVKALFQKLFPGRKYYLTNIQAMDLKPEDVRQWPDDLWMFPYYTNRSMVPFDARKGGPAATAYEGMDVISQKPVSAKRRVSNSVFRLIGIVGLTMLFALLLFVSHKKSKAHHV